MPRLLQRLPPRNLALFAIAIVASIAFVVIAALLRTPGLDSLDIDVELAVHRLDSPLGDAVMRSATVIGSNWVLLPVVAVVAVVAWLRRRRAIAVVLALDTVVVLLANEALKLLFRRPRPRLFDKIALPTDFSFPSGHSMSAMGVYGVIAAVAIALAPGARRPVIAAAVLLIAAIGLSRVYLGVHWPFDVVGGFLGGIPPLVTAVWLIRRSRPR